MINPGLERRGHVEVTHRGGDDDLICGEQLRDEFIGDLEGGRMLVGMFIGSGDSAGDLGQINVENFVVARSRVTILLPTWLDWRSVAK